jgi:hypothetical protein
MRYTRFGIFLVFISFLSVAQDNPLRGTAQRWFGQREVIKQKPGQAGRVRVMRDGTTKVQTVDRTERLNLIVEFKEEPPFVVELQHPLTALNKSSLRARFSQFSTDLGMLTRSASATLKLNLGDVVVRRELAGVFFGAAITAPRALYSSLQSLPYVKRIHYDRRIQALLDESVHLIRADSVWTAYGKQGQGVIVGIIDTGIDYFNPALGGGFGPNFKVVGGYDLENNDSDPRDDNGHGTHVAGIVAADGQNIKGVAPKAKLMAYKVLDADGFGFESNVIAAVDSVVRARADIANMSLGAPGDPEDALSVAVDNAVKVGVTFCVAAGNSGSFRGISSPGTARRAITVGASSKSDGIAPFSAKGPTKRIHGLKPDIVAPGVLITSTVLNNALDSYSGTSMASPHIAGVAALLKSIHPAWPPAKIKSAIMTTAVDLGEEPMVQGAGRVDALKSAGVKSFAVPSNLSFGLDSSNQDTWTRLDTLWVYNSFSEAQSYAISTTSLPSGITISPTPSSFSLAVGDSQMVQVALAVNNNIVPYPEGGSLSYGGSMFIRGTVDTMRVPWAFVKAARLFVTSDAPAFFSLVSRTYAAFSYEADSATGTYFELVVPKGSYDLLAEIVDFSSRHMRLIFREKLAVNDFDRINLSAAEVNKMIHFAAVDDQSNPLVSYPFQQSLYTLAFPDSSYVGQWLYFGFDDTVFHSGFSGRFTLLSGQQAFDGQRKVFVVQHQPMTNIQLSSIVAANSPADYIKQHLRTEFPPTSPENGVSFYFWNRILFDTLWAYITFAGDDPARVSGNPWDGLLFNTRDVHPHYGFATSFDAFSSTTSLNSPSLHLSSLPFGVLRDSIGTFLGNKVAPNLFLSPHDGVLSFGGAPLYTDAYFANNVLADRNFAAAPYFFGPLDDFRSFVPASFKLYDNSNVIVATDTLFRLRALSLTPNAYRLEVIHQGYFVNGVRGRATLNASFDLRRTDANPPGLSSLRVLNAQSVPVGVLKKNEQAMLQFAANDLNTEMKNDDIFYRYQSIADSTKLYYRRFGTSTWQQLPLTFLTEDSASTFRIGKLYAADISSTTVFDSAAIDLRFEFWDRSGNWTQWTLEPAFGVGTFGFLTSADDERSSSPEIPKVFSLLQNYPNPFNPQTRIVFDLPKRANVSLTVFNILGQQVATLIEGELAPGRHEIVWTAKTNQGYLLNSGIYFYRLSADEFVQTRKLLLLR